MEGNEDGNVVADNFECLLGVSSQGLSGMRWEVQCGNASSESPELIIRGL